MNKEYFKILKEISSLEEAIQKLEGENQEETSRVEKLEARREEAKTELDLAESKAADLSKSSVSNENALTSTDAKLKKLSADIAGSFDSKNLQGMELEAKKLQAHLDALEEEGLSILDEIESLSELIKEKKEFLKGISETIEEIGKEVGEVCGKNQKSIESLISRAKILREQLPENFTRAYEQVKSRNLKVSNFSSIENGICGVCKMKVDKTREKEVEETLALKTCSSCGRIFIPKESLY